MDDLRFDTLRNHLWFSVEDDGTVEIYADVDGENTLLYLTRDQVVSLENWLTEYLTGGGE